MRLFRYKDATYTEPGTKKWNEIEEKLRAILIDLYEKDDVPLIEGLLLIHDAAGAAAQHAANRIASVERAEKK